MADASLRKAIDYKQQEAQQQLQRIGKVALPALLPIAGSDKTIHYRNKLEFTFSNRRFLNQEEINSDREIPRENALGYHVPRIFDKVLDIQECWLMDPVNNTIRNSIREIAQSRNYNYYDIKEHTGWLRNIVIRYCNTGELMVNMVFGNDDDPESAIFFLT